jgi:OmpA-OmpF porin, OOP family
MKKIITLFALTLAFTSAAQTEEMNQWSVGVNIGGHDGYAPSRATSHVYQIHHYALNGRYMFNNRLGIKLDLGYDLIDYNGSGGNNPNYFRTTISGVVNVGDMIKLHSISDRLGLLIHGGTGLSHLWLGEKSQPKTGNETDPLFKKVDDMINFRFGATPQFKLNEKLSLNADLSYTFHARQTYEWTMQTRNWHKHGITGYMLNISVGASYYFGSKAKHADWTPTVYGGTAKEVDMSKYDQLVKELQERTKDDDKDGVANYADVEPNTPEGSYVNSKGEALKDRDNDGIADEYDLCPDIKGSFSMDGCVDSDGDGIGDSADACPTVPGIAANKGCPEVSKAVKEVMNKALKGVQFETNKDVLLPASFPVLNEVVKVMMDYPEYNLAIEGHTDNVGNDDANMILSKNRAQSCAVYLMSKGISGDRLKVEGFGETRPKALNDTQQGKALNRRVEFNVVF